MIIAKIYGLLWLVTAAIGGVLYLIGSFSSAVSVIYGFVVAVLSGAAILAIVPTLVSELVSTGHRSRENP